MSELMTSVRIGDQCGYAEYGNKSRKEMIEQYRRRAERRKMEAEEVLAAKDSEFIVEQYRGVHVMRNLKRIDA